jgi:hypothetical protein
LGLSLATTLALLNSAQVTIQHRMTAAKIEVKNPAAAEKK